MKSPGIIDGVVVALLIAIAAALAGLLFGVVGSGGLLGLLLPWATLIYLLYLLRRSDARIGRVVAISAWAAASLACWLFGMPLAQQVLVQAGMIWLLRSLYFHNSLLAAALDLGLVAAGLAAAGWALINTGSPAAALWSFFLLQSLFSWIGEFDRRKASMLANTGTEASTFQCAHRVAIDAVRKLTQT